MVGFRSLSWQAAMKVLARLVEKVDESIRKRHDASRENSALRTRRRGKATVKA
jgi:hypothetical protein